MKTKTLVSILILVIAVMIITGSSAIASNTEVFFQSVKSGDYAEVKKLLEEGVDVNDKTPDGYTALMLAAGAGHLNILELLLLEGADINGRGHSDYTALMITAIAGTTEVIQPVLNLPILTMTDSTIFL